MVVVNLFYLFIDLLEHGTTQAIIKTAIQAGLYLGNI